MKKFMIEYINIIGYAVVGLVFAYSSFYFLINLYHAKEVARLVTINPTEDVAYISVVEKIEQVRNNIAEFTPSQYTGTIPVHTLLNIQGRIENCAKQFENETFVGLKDKTQLTIYDIEKLRQSYQNEILSTCLVEQFYDLAVSDQTNHYVIPSLQQIAPYMELDIKNLLTSNTYLTADLLNNHIYYFTTDHTYTNLLGKQKLAYSELLSAYNRAADLVMKVSEWFQEEVK